MSHLLPQEHGSAERAFLEGRTEEAVLLWKAALADPDCKNEGSIEFNLGLAATRLGHHAEALWHFRRAGIALPGEAVVMEQQTRAENALGLPASMPDTHALGAGTAWFLLVLATLLEFTSVALFCSRRPRTRARRVALLVTALLGIGLCTGVFIDHAQRQPAVAVVLEEAAVHADPLHSAPVALKLRPGTSVRVLAATDRWALVVTPQGTGYVPRARLGLVD